MTVSRSTHRTSRRTRHRAGHRVDDRPARTAVLLGAAATLVVGALVGAPGAAAQDSVARASAPDVPDVRPLTTWAPGSVSPSPRPTTSSPVPTPAEDTPPPATGPGDGLPRTPTPSPTIIADPWGCVADLSVVSQWPGGFVATVKVRNLNGFFPVEMWTVDVHVPGGEVTGAWNATTDGASPGRFTPAPWSPRVGYSGTAEFGFQATGAPGNVTATCRPGF